MVDFIEMNDGKKMAVVIVWTKLIGLRQNAVSKNWACTVYSCYLCVEVGIEFSGTVLKSVGCVWV